MTMMASGRLWQIARCLGARPGILLQMMLAPRATTEEKPLEQGTQRNGMLGQQGGGHGLQALPGCLTLLSPLPTPTHPCCSQQGSPNFFDTAPLTHTYSFCIPYRYYCSADIRY